MLRIVSFCYFLTLVFAQPPEVAQWIGSYTVTTVIPCDSTVRNCGCLTGNVTITAAANMVISGACTGECSNPYSDGFPLPTSSLTPPREWNNFDYIFNLTERNGTITVLATNLDSPACSFSLSRPTPTNFTYVPPSDNVCIGYCGVNGNCIINTTTNTPSCICSNGYTGDFCKIPPIPPAVQAWIGDWKLSTTLRCDNVTTGPTPNCCCFAGPLVHISPDESGAERLIIGGLVTGPGCNKPDEHDDDDVGYPNNNLVAQTDFFNDIYNISSDATVTTITFTDIAHGACAFALEKPSTSTPSPTKPPTSSATRTHISGIVWLLLVAKLLIY